MFPLENREDYEALIRGEGLKVRTGMEKEGMKHWRGQEWQCAQYCESWCVFTGHI